MEDEELESIRQKKFAELQQQQEAAEQRAQQETAAKQQIETVLRQILVPDAWEQWNNLKYRDSISGTSFAHQVAVLLIQAAQSGQIQGKISKEQLKRFLSIVQQKTSREIKIKGLSEKFRSGSEAQGRSGAGAQKQEENKEKTQ